MRGFTLGFVAAAMLAISVGAMAAPTRGYKLFLNDVAQAPTAGVDCMVMHTPRVTGYRRVLQGRYSLWCGPRRFKTADGTWYPVNPTSILMTDAGLVVYGGASGKKTLYQGSWR